MGLMQLKTTAQSVLDPLVHGLERAGVSANAVTVASIALCMAQGVAVLVTPSALAIVLPTSILRIAMNVVDGQLARRRGPSARGTVLDEISYPIGDVAQFLPLAWVPGVSTPLMVTAVMLFVLIEYVGLAPVRAGSERLFSGVLSKPDRCMIVGCLALALALWPAGLWTTVALVGLVALCVVTLGQRLWTSLR